MRGKVIIRRGQDGSLQVVMMGSEWNAWRLRQADQDQEAF